MINRTIQQKKDLDRQSTQMEIQWSMSTWKDAQLYLQADIQIKNTR